MKIYKKLLIIVALLTIFSCQKDLSITEFSDDFSNYESELRIEALILPTENTAIVRVDKSVLITDTSLYEGFWHGDADSTIANCGDWNPLIHDVGIDGQIGDPTDDDGDCENCSYDNTVCQENCRDEDSIGENNGVPDCGEPNVDNYNELLPDIHEGGCVISMTRINSRTKEILEKCDFIFDPSAGEFFDIRFTGSKEALVDDFYTVNYGAYIPDGCSEIMWVVNLDDTEDPEPEEYHFNADCSAAGFGIVSSKEPITVSNPVVFVDTILNSTIQNPESQMDVAEYLENLGINNCTAYNCLEEKMLEDNFVYFPRYSQFSSILWATISPNVYFEVTEYMKYMDDSTYFHGHPSIGTDFFNIVNDVCLMSEAVFSDYYDGYGNGEWDDNADSEDYDGAEIFADENGNGEYDEGEFFIDRGDNIGDIDTYYYEISTFSESYKNYYYYSQLLPNDPERSNLLDENMNPVMGAFGSITTNRIDFQIIDCFGYSFDSDQNIQWDYSTKEECEDQSNTHGVCQWFEEETIEFFNAPTYNGSVCAPINFFE